MRFRGLYFLVSMLFVSSPSIAGPGTGAFTINKIHIENGDVFVIAKDPIADPLNCKTPQFVKLNKNDVGFSEMYSMALSAYAMNARMVFFLRECDSSPWANDVPKAYAAQIVK